MKNNLSREVTMFPLEEEYKKPTGIKPADIEKLREWLKTQAHLPGDHITDPDLILAYHSCSHSTEVTKQVLDLNLTLRTLFTSLFQNRVFDERVERTLNTITLKPLPTRSRDGYACIYAYFNDKDPKNFVVLDTLKTVLMIMDLWQYEEGTWPGFIVVADLQNIGISHLMCFDYTNLQHFFFFVQEAMWMKTKAVHFINAPPFMDKIMSMLKPLVKNLDFFIIHSRGYSSFETIMPLEALPKDVGGNYMSLEECKADTIAKLKTNSAFFEAESLKRVCESRRPGKPKTVTDFFGGVEGSFKKLDID